MAGMAADAVAVGLQDRDRVAGLLEQEPGHQSADPSPDDQDVLGCGRGRETIVDQDLEVLEGEVLTVRAHSEQVTGQRHAGLPALGIEHLHRGPDPAGPTRQRGGGTGADEGGCGRPRRGQRSRTEDK